MTQLFTHFIGPAWLAYTLVALIQLALIFALVLVGNAAGASILGWFFQLTHSYTMGFTVFEILLAAACGLMLTLGPYRYPAFSGH